MGLKEQVKPKSPSVIIDVTRVFSRLLTYKSGSEWIQSRKKIGLKTARNLKSRTSGPSSIDEENNPDV